MSKTPWFVRIGRPTYGAYLLVRNHVKTIGMEQLKEVKPPFLVLANHTHTMDPFFISAASPIHIRWVAGAYLFKLKGLKALLIGLIQAISKQQGRSDLFTIRTISEALKAGDAVGLFPEGTRTWDGEPVGFEDATTKLAKLFKVPIFFVNLEGFYGLKPRWAYKKRKGEVILRVLPPLMPDEIASLSVEQLSAVLHKGLDYSYRDWQQEHNHSFWAQRQAEALERVLYLCPDCKQPSTLSTKKDRIVCKQCGMSVNLDEHDRLHSVQGTNPFQDVAAWHAWEYGMLSEIPDFPPDHGVLFQTGDTKSLKLLSKRFSLYLDCEGMTLDDVHLGTLRLAFSDVQSMIINAKNTVELYHKDTLYRVRLKERECILKYVEMYKTFRNRSTP